MISFGVFRRDCKKLGIMENDEGMHKEVIDGKEFRAQSFETNL